MERAMDVGVQATIVEGGLAAGTAEEHLRLICTGVVARILVQLRAQGETFAAVLAAAPFLEAYEAHLEGLLPRDLPPAAAPRWCDEQIAAFERHTPGHLPLRALATRLQLPPLALRIFVAAGLVEEDVRFGTLFAQLQEPQGSRRPCAGMLGWLLQELPYAQEPIWPHVQALTAAGLLSVENPDDIRPEWRLRVPPAVWDAVAGACPAHPAPGLAWQPPDEFPATADLILPPELVRQVQALPGLLRRGEVSALVVRGMTGSGRRTVLGAVAREFAAGLLLCRANYEQNRGTLGPLATLLGALPAVRCDPAPGEALELGELPGYRGVLGVTLGREGGLRGEQFARSLVLSLPPPDAARRRRFWEGSAPPGEVERLAGRFLLTGGYIRRTAAGAAAAAALDGRGEYGVADVQEAARGLNRQALETLATPLPAVEGWGALVLDSVTADDLRLLEARCRQREHLRAEAGPALRQGLTRGVRALFTGPSGTGKTLAARALGGALQMDVYRVDLAAVVNKYIGETERNLNQVFGRAEELDVILLLDEGDSLMTQRTDVRNANDRYANLETNYLLQRLESYEGIVVVTTNAGQRIDSAFLRRFDLIVDFAPPDAGERLRLWIQHLPPAHAVGGGFLQEVAAACVLTGGQIRGAALNATLLALEDGGVVQDAHLGAALRREYRKVGGVFPLVG